MVNKNAARHPSHPLHKHFQPGDEGPAVRFVRVIRAITEELSGSETIARRLAELARDFPLYEPDELVAAMTEAERWAACKAIDAILKLAGIAAVLDIYAALKPWLMAQPLDAKQFNEWLPN